MFVLKNRPFLLAQVRLSSDSVTGRTSPAVVCPLLAAGRWGLLRHKLHFKCCFSISEGFPGGFGAERSFSHKELAHSSQGPVRNGHSGKGSKGSTENCCVTEPVTVVLYIPAALCKAACFDK